MKTGYEKHFQKVKQQSSKGHSVKPMMRSKAPRTNGKEKKSAFPVLPLFCFVIIAGSGLIFLDNFDSAENFLKKVEFSMGTAQAEEVKVPATVTDAAAPANPDQKSTQVEAKKADDADYLFKLAERKKQLDQREEELTKVAAQIEKQKNEINEKLLKLEEVRGRISSALEEKIKTDDGKVETLVQMYTNMKPQQAAAIFEKLDEDLVIEILGRMKKKSAADILNLIKAEKAQIFAERYTGYRAPASK